MDRTNVPRRLLRLVGRIAVWTAGVALVSPALADQLEQHNQLVNQFVNDMHADPLVADCAAHGNFVASTSTAFDHVEFPPTAFDSVHASVTPWNDAFDEGKQRVKVDSIVTVDGFGIRSNGGDPTELHFRCGYVGSQMLAFSWNDPVPPLRPVVSRAATADSVPSAHGKHVAHGNASSTKKAAGKTSKKGSTKATKAAKATANSSAKSTGKSAGKSSSSKSTAHKTNASTTKKKH